MAQVMKKLPAILLSIILAAALALTMGLTAQTAYAAEDQIDNDYSIGRDMEDFRIMLPEWDGFISNQPGLRIQGPEDSAYEEEAEFNYTVTNVELLGDDADKILKVTPDDDGKGWDYRAVGYGRVTVKVSYENPEELVKANILKETGSYEYDIEVSRDVYGFELDTQDGADKYLPNQKVELDAYDAWHDQRLSLDVEQEHFEISNENAKYHWVITNGEEYATLVDKPGGKAELTLLPKPEINEDDFYHGDIGVQVVMYEDTPDKVLAERTLQVTVEQDFMDIYPTPRQSGLRDLDVGDSVNIVPELRHYSLDSEASKKYEVENGAEFEWGNHEIVDITENEGAFTIKRLQSWGDGLQLMATLAGGAGEDPFETDRWYWMNEEYYEFWIEEEGDRGSVYSDGTLALFADTDMELNEKVTLEWTVGIINQDADEDEESIQWIKEFDEGFTVDPADGKKITLDGEKLSAQKNANGEPIESVDVVATLRNGDTVLYQNRKWVNIDEARIEYDQEQDRDMLPGWGGFIDKKQNVHVENSAYPDGEDFDYTVTGVEVTKQDPKTAGEKVVIVEPDDEDQGWDYRAEAFGTATITVSYKNPEELVDAGSVKPTGSYDFEVSVDTDVYEVHLNTDNGSDVGLLGSKKNMIATLNHYKDGEDEVPTEDLTCEWSVPDFSGEEGDRQDLATVAADKDNSTKAVVSYKNPKPEDKGNRAQRFDERFDVTVTVKDGNEEVAEESMQLRVCSDYMEMEPLRMSEDLAVGATQKEIFTLYHYNQDLGEDEFGGREPVENAHFYWRYCDEDVEITDSEGNIVGNDKIGENGEPVQDEHGNTIYNDSEFTTGSQVEFNIKRLNRNGTNIHVEARWGENESGCERREYHLDEKNCRIWFYSGPAFDDSEDFVYDDGTLTYTVMSQDLPEDAQIDCELRRGNGEELADKYFEMQKDGKGREQIVLKGEELAKDNIRWVLLRASATVNGEVVCTTYDDANDEDHWQVCEVRKAGIDYGVEDNRMLPGWGDTFDGRNRLSIANTEHPLGLELDYDVTGIEVTDGEEFLQEDFLTEDNGKKYLKKDSNEDGCWYDFRIKEAKKLDMEQLGNVEFRLSYQLDEEQMAKEGVDDVAREGSFTVTTEVVSEMYIARVWPADGSQLVLPGGTIDMEASGEKAFINDEGEERTESEDFDFRWNIVKGEEFIEKIDVDEEHPDLAKVTIRDDKDIDEEIRVEVEIGYPDEENPEEFNTLACDDTPIWVKGEYHQIFPAVLTEEQAGLEVGESMTIEPELWHYQYGQERNRVEGAQFSIEGYDDGAIDVEEKDGAFTITRKGDWSTDFLLKASWGTGEDDWTDQEYRLFDVGSGEEGDDEEHYDWTVCFQGDAHYDWAYFYPLEDPDASLRREDLDISVLNEDGKTVDAKDYDLTITRETHADGEEQAQHEDVEGAVGLADADKNTESGFTEYEATVTQGEDVKSRATFYVVDRYSLNWICANVYFENVLDDGGWRMHDRYWFEEGTLEDPEVSDKMYSPLKKDRDYTLTYYRRSGDIDTDEANKDYSHGFDYYLDRDESEKLGEQETPPNEPGAYFVDVTGKGEYGSGEYYGASTILLDVLSGADSLKYIQAWNIVFKDGNTVLSGENDWARFFVDEGETINAPTVELRRGKDILASTNYNYVIEKETVMGDADSCEPIADNEKLTHAKLGSRGYRVTVWGKKGSDFTGKKEKWIDVCSRTCLCPDSPDVEFVDAEKYYIEMDPQFVGWQGAYNVPRGVVLSTKVVIDGKTLKEGTDYTCQYAPISEIWWTRDEVETIPENNYTDTFPTKKGTYLVRIKGTGKKGEGYYGETSVLRFYVVDNDNVDAVQAAINALNSTNPNKNAVKAARKAYDALSKSEQKLVKADKLIAAEKALKIAKGTTHKVEGQTYKVLSPGNLTVSFVTAKNAKTVTVPATVKIEGKTFKVTQVDAKAFKASKIRTITVGNNVATINADAFNGSKATTVTLGTGVTTLKAKAFNGSNVTTVTLKTKKLTKNASVKNAFKGSKAKNLTIKVNVGTKADNKKFVKTYKKVFTKANLGCKKVTVK